MEIKSKFYMFVVSFLVVSFLWEGCDSRRNPEHRTYESSYNSNSKATETPRDGAYLENSLNTGSSPYDEKTSSIEDDPYYNHSLKTGSTPYSSYGKSVDNESQINVSTSSNSNCDIVVIIKRSGEIARNAYIKAGGSYTFNIPNGTYQVFFYGGKGWNPNKVMPNGLKGGFVANESFSKDSPVSLEYEGLTYELILQPNGNFSTQQSSASEIF